MKNYFENLINILKSLFVKYKLLLIVFIIVLLATLAFILLPEKENITYNYNISNGSNNYINLPNNNISNN